MILSRRSWKEQQDQSLVDLILRLGTRNWGAIAHALHYELGYKERSGKQCRERWHNQLNPELEKGKWTEEEEKLVFELHARNGNRWTTIAQQLPGRTDNAIKNFFYSTIRRSLRRMSKLVGEKNSTVFVRDLKPITLSRLQRDSWSSLPFDRAQQVRRTCRFLKTEILAFTKTSIGKHKREKSEQTFNTDVLSSVLKQIVTINRICEDQTRESESEEQILPEERSQQVALGGVKIQAEESQSVAEREEIEKDTIKKRESEEPEQQERNQLRLKVEDVGAEHNDIYVPFQQTNYLNAPAYCNMDYYYYQPLLYFEPTDQPLPSHPQPPAKPTQEPDLPRTEPLLKMQQKQQPNQNEPSWQDKLEGERDYFKQGKIPPLNSLRSNPTHTTLKLTRPQYHQLLTDFSQILTRRLHEWNLQP